MYVKAFHLFTKWSGGTQRGEFMKVEKGQTFGFLMIFYLLFLNADTHLIKISRGKILHFSSFLKIRLSLVY
jgi:hypothetical protein